MNGQLDLNGYDLANLDLNSVERIEILKGPQSTLYGSDAMAGVINIITRKEEIRRYHPTRNGRYHIHRTAAGISGGRRATSLYSSIDFSNYSDGFSATKNNRKTDGLIIKPALSNRR